MRPGGARGQVEPLLTFPAAGRGDQAGAIAFDTEARRGFDHVASPDGEAQKEAERTRPAGGSSGADRRIVGRGR